MSKIDFTLRKNTKLEDRSYLCFEFYRSNGDIKSRFLPFFQNPEIEESKRANYVRYQPLGRSSTLFTYTGAEARAYNLNFRIALPNVLEFQGSWRNNTFGNKVKTKEETIAAWKNTPKMNDNPGYWAAKGNANDFDKHFFDIKSDEVGTLSTDQNGLFPDPNPRHIDPDTEAKTDRQKTIDIIMYWVNLIRSSAINNSKDPTYGPPIVRLNHGILYQDIPCICLDYKVNMDDGAGYDLKTMLPRVIQISMNLMEYRAGNFGKYNITKYVDRDNIVGWESLIGGTNTIDPIRLDIGRQWTN